MKDIYDSEEFSINEISPYTIQIQPNSMNQNEFLNSIQCSLQEWNDALENNTYSTFKIPKSNGKFRTIEAPSKSLKKVQRKIARFLQSKYHEALPSCVHGYILKDPIRMISRDIRTNAMAHLGKPFLLNVDLKDFFHQVNRDVIQNIWEDLGISDDRLHQMLTLCFKNKRLPMGAPTSPVISNMAFLKADKELMGFAKNHQLTYTRYVDDLSFSSQTKITAELFEKIDELICENGFRINPKKVKRYGKHADKLITGIVLRGLNMEVSPSMIERTEKNLALYSKLMRMRHHMKYLGVKPNSVGKTKWSTIRSSVKGHLSFIKLIEGKNSTRYKSLKRKYTKASQFRKDFEFTIYI